MNHQDSFDVENLVVTPTDSELQMSPPFPPPLSLLQDFENFDCTPTNLGLPTSPPLPLLPSDMNNTDVVQSAQAVKLQGAFELPDFTSTPTDSGLQMSPPSPPPLPLLPPPMNTDLAQSAEAVKLQAFELPDFTSTPTDVELVRDHLCPAIQRLPGKRLFFGPAVVNADLPSMAPWELPGMIARNNKGGMRDKYYLTDHRDLRFSASFDRVRTTNGFWQKHAHETVIRAEHNRLVGVKKTMKFHTYTGTKTNWIMNVYYTWNEGSLFVKDGLFLCHVFEAGSPDYNDSPKCLGCHPGACSGNHSGQAVGAPSNASFKSPHPGSWPMHHDQDLTPLLAELSIFMGDPDLNNSAGYHSGQAFGAPSNASFNSTHPGLNSYIAELGNLLLGDPDPDNSADTGNSSARRGDPPTDDHGQSKKRKKISDVWDYFTKIFARDIDGKVLTFAACNHCCKILTGSSKGGTTHLARHTCPCKFKPVAAGRSAKDSGGDVNVVSF